MNFNSSPISSLCLIWASAFRIWLFNDTFFNWSLSISASFALNLSSMYFINFSASYFPVLPFSAAERKRPKSKASFLISAMERSVPSKIALSLSRSVSDFSRPSSMLYLSVSSSLFAISYFYSGLSFFGWLSWFLFLPFFFWLSSASSMSLCSAFVLRKIYD